MVILQVLIHSEQVFCDSSADVKSLGCKVANTQDIQVLATRKFKAPARLGLGSLGSRFVFGGGPCVKNKNGWKHFAFIKSRPGPEWPSLHTQTKLCQYAAADAWMTLRVFEAMTDRCDGALGLKPLTSEAAKTDADNKEGRSAPSAPAAKVSSMIFTSRGVAL